MSIEAYGNWPNKGKCRYLLRMNRIELQYCIYVIETLEVLLDKRISF